MLQFHGVPAISAMIQHHTPNQHPKSSQIYGFVVRMVGVAKKLMDKVGKEGKLWISGLYDYRVAPQSGSIALPLQLMTQHTPREKDLPQIPSTLGAQECTKLDRNSWRGKGTSQKRVTLNSIKVHQFGSSTGRTSNNGKPVCTKLLLDHAGEWHRTVKSIQAHQDNAGNQIYSNSCQMDRTHEGLSDRNQKIRV